MNRAPEQRASSSKIQDIEVLRGIAVLFVVIHHSHGNLITQPHVLFDLFYSYFGLSVGVDMFFAISGFVITRQLAPTLLACDTSVQRARQAISFWVRRAWRLLPSAWLWLLIILAATVFLNRSGAFGSIRANYEATIAGFLQVANFRIAKVFGRSEYGASFAYWSLSLEEQFYLVYPFLILFLRGKLPWVLGAIAAAQLILPRTDLGIVLRTDAVALGALIALWQMHVSYRLADPLFMRHRSVRWLILSVLLIFIGALGAVSIHVVPYRQSLISLLAAALVFFASYGAGYAAPPAFLKSILVWVGARSYALYLIHVPVFFITREIFFRLAQAGIVDGSEHWLRMLVTFIAIAIVLVEINYRYVEMPCRRYGANLAKLILAKNHAR